MVNESLQVCMKKAIYCLFPNGMVWVRFNKEDVMTIYFMSIAIGEVDYKTRTLTFFDIDSHREMYQKEIDNYQKIILQLPDIIVSLDKMLNKNILCRFLSKAIFCKTIFVFDEIKAERQELKRMHYEVMEKLVHCQEQVARLERNRKPFISALNNVTIKIYRELLPLGFNYNLDGLTAPQNYLSAVERLEDYVLKK